MHMLLVIPTQNHVEIATAATGRILSGESSIDFGYHTERLNFVRPISSTRNECSGRAYSESPAVLEAFAIRFSVVGWYFPSEQSRSANSFNVRDGECLINQTRPRKIEVRSHDALSSMWEYAQS